MGRTATQQVGIVALTAVPPIQNFLAIVFTIGFFIMQIWDD